MKPTKKQQAKIKRLKRQSRKYSVLDGIFATIRNSLGNAYVVPFAVAINTSNSLIALFSSIPGLLGPISQWFSSRLIEKHKRKKIVTTAVFFEILMWLPLITIAFLFYKGIILSTLPILFHILHSSSKHRKSCLVFLDRRLSR